MDILKAIEKQTNILIKVNEPTSTEDTPYSVYQTAVIKQELNERSKRKPPYKGKKGKMYSAVMVQCSEEMVTKLEAATTYKDVKDISDIIQIMKLVKMLL